MNVVKAQPADLSNAMRTLGRAARAAAAQLALADRAIKDDGLKTMAAGLRACSTEFCPSRDTESDIDKSVAVSPV